MSVRTVISQELKRQPRLFDAARRITRLWEPTPIYDALSAISRRLSEVAFIQIGSNDGISIDPIREFVVASLKWHGTLVEPVPDLFEACKKNYSYLRNRRLQFLNVAVSKEGVSRQFWKIKTANLSAFPLFARQIGSFDPEHILKHFPHMQDLEKKIESIPVPCMTYEQVVAQSGLSRVHVLHLDVEGYEAEILSQVDLGGPKPLMVVFEISHMLESARKECFERLQNHGYHLKEVGADCIAALEAG